MRTKKICLEGRQQDQMSVEPSVSDSMIHAFLDKLYNQVPPVF